MANHRKDQQGEKGKTLRTRVTSRKAKLKLAAYSKARNLREEAEGDWNLAPEVLRRVEANGRKERLPKTRRLVPKPVSDEPNQGQSATPSKKRRPHSQETVSQNKKRNTSKDTPRAVTVTRKRQAPKFFYALNGVKRKCTEDITERVGTKKRSVSTNSAKGNKKRKTGDKTAKNKLQCSCRKAKPNAGFGENKPRECLSSLLARGIASLRNTEVKKTRRSKSIFSLVCDYMGENCLASLMSASRASTAKGGIGGARGEPIEVKTSEEREERPFLPPVSYSQETLFGPTGGTSTNPGPTVDDRVEIITEVDPKPPPSSVGASTSSFFNGTMPSTSSANYVFGGCVPERGLESPPSSLALSASSSEDSEAEESGINLKVRTDTGPATVFGRCKIQVSRIPNLFSINRGPPVLSRVYRNPQLEPLASSSRDPGPRNTWGSPRLSYPPPSGSPNREEASPEEAVRNVRPDTLQDIEAESVCRLLQRKGPKQRFHTSLPSK